MDGKRIKELKKLKKQVEVYLKPVLSHEEVKSYMNSVETSLDPTSVEGRGLLGSINEHLNYIKKNSDASEDEHTDRIKEMFREQLEIINNLTSF